MSELYGKTRNPDKQQLPNSGVTRKYAKMRSKAGLVRVWSKDQIQQAILEGDIVTGKHNPKTVSQIRATYPRKDKV